MLYTIPAAAGFLPSTVHWPHRCTIACLGHASCCMLSHEGLRALPCQKPRHGIQHRNRPMPTILGGANIHHPLNCSHNLPFGASLLELRSQQIELLDSIIRVRLSRVLTGQGALWKVLLRSRMARACTLEFVVGRVRSPTDNFSLKNRIFQMDSKECYF